MTVWIGFIVGRGGFRGQRGVRYYCEYRRTGTVNLFVFLDVHRPWRKVKVTKRRTAADFAACMRELTDFHFPEAETIRVAMDNLSTHSAASLCFAISSRNAATAPSATRQSHADSRLTIYRRKV